MAIHDDLGNRMKGYENVSKTRLIKRSPVIIRIDGKAFHTFTKGFKKPFDKFLVRCMQETMLYLCQNIQGCIFGYTQSDEISLILTDYATFETDAWFDYEVQKLCSITASMTTMKFNRLLFNNNKGAVFDSRCFNLSKEEVTNYIYWRQLDAKRNSILAVGQSCFSHKELQNKTCNMILKMLADSNEYVNWEDYPVYLKWGTACIKLDNKWILDLNMPLLKGDNREYLEKFI
jgi:tRNA(His) 5'-end guanylyltransferase